MNRNFVIGPLSGPVGFARRKCTGSACHMSPRRSHVTAVPSSVPGSFFRSPPTIFARLKMTENVLVNFSVLFVSGAISQSFTIILKNVEGAAIDRPPIFQRVTSTLRVICQGFSISVVLVKFDGLRFLREETHCARISDLSDDLRRLRSRSILPENNKGRKNGTAPTRNPSDVKSAVDVHRQSLPSKSTVEVVETTNDFHRKKVYSRNHLAAVQDQPWVAPVRAASPATRRP